MKKHFLRIISAGLVVLISVTVIHSCKKDRKDDDTQSSVDNSICEAEFSRLLPQSNSIAVGDSGVLRTVFDFPLPFNNCPDYSIVHDTNTADGFPVTLWMYFGEDIDGDGVYETGCTGSNDGKTRRGVIKAVFDGKWSKPGSTVTMYLINYFVNEIQFEGTVSVTRSASSFSQTVSGGKCSKGSAWTILWNCTRTVSIHLGDTLNPLDDVCTITGSAKGTDRNNASFSVEIDPNNPITREMNCRWITKGKQTIKIDGKKDRTIDYGDGTCDDKAKLIIDGNAFILKLE